MFYLFIYLYLKETFITKLFNYETKLGFLHIKGKGLLEDLKWHLMKWQENILFFVVFCKHE